MKIEFSRFRPVLSFFNRVAPKGVGRGVPVVALALFSGNVLTVNAADDESYYRADFEAPAFAAGSVQGQRGWSVEQGRAEVVAGAGREKSAGLVLEPLEPFSQATLLLSAAPSTGSPSFLDVYVLPAATEEKRQEEMLDLDGARIGLFR